MARIPIIVGNLTEVAGLFAAAGLILVAREITTATLGFVLYLGALLCLIFFPHCLAHFVVGRLVGIRFTGYSVDRSSITKLRLGPLTSIADKVPIFTLHTNRQSLRSVTRTRRNAMFMSGAIASMIFPLLAAVASLGHLPTFLTGLLLLLSIGNFVFDIYYSPRAGDFSRTKSDSPT